MISLALKDGTHLRSFPKNVGNIQYHRVFGFVSDDALAVRAKNRRRHGLKKAVGEPDFKFEVIPSQGSRELNVKPVFGCEVKPDSEQNWIIHTSQGEFILRPVAFPETTKLHYTVEKKDRALSLILMLALLLVLIPFGIRKPEAPAPVVAEEPVTVQVIPPVQRQQTVAIKLEDLPKEIRQEKMTRQAVNQNLGFLKLLGKKDLTKVLGGVPTQLKDASPGAGPGGKEGSGGELLTGLGEGLKRTTVGNTGVKGLGGIGTKGAGGGLGGYGNSLIGSGNGKTLSSVAVSDDVYMDGGLDRSVVQATIAKYLSQVRACYEEGLKKNQELAGTVSMNFEIGGEGMLNYARVARSTLGDKNVESCISQKMMGWKFPSPRGKMAVKVNYPFLLRPLGSG